MNYTRSNTEEDLPEVVAAAVVEAVPRAADDVLLVPLLRMDVTLAPDVVDLPPVFPLQGTTRQIQHLS